MGNTKSDHGGPKTRSQKLYYNETIQEMDYILFPSQSAWLQLALDFKKASHLYYELCKNQMRIFIIRKEIINTMPSKPYQLLLVPYMPINYAEKEIYYFIGSLKDPMLIWQGFISCFVLATNASNKLDIGSSRKLLPHWMCWNGMGSSTKLNRIFTWASAQYAKHFTTLLYSL